MADVTQQVQAGMEQVQQNGLTDAEDDERGKARPADIDADMREMERRKRVEMIMSSRLFREELERILDGQLREGGAGGASGLLQRLGEMMGVSAARVPAGAFKSANCVLPINDIRGVESMGYGKGEKILRCKLAAAFRLMDMYGWAQGIDSQITARLNHDQELFLVNPYGLLYHEVTASSLVKANMQGTVLEQGTTNFGVNLPGFLLHSAVHAARPDVRCVIHVACPPVLAVSALRGGLLPVSRDAALVGDVATHQYIGGMPDDEERDRLSRSLGPVSKVLLLTHHGAVCCGETVEEAFYVAQHVVAACEAQLRLMPAGLENLTLIPDEVRRQIYETSRRAPDSTGSSGAHNATTTSTTTTEADGATVTMTTTTTTTGGGATTVQDVKDARLAASRWRLGGPEFEALMRMLDNAGYRTGYIYRQPLVKGEPPRPKNEVEVPPAVSSLGYLLEEEEMYRQGIWKKLDGRKGHDRTRWLNSPNVYQKVEILETGTPDPKKITKWVDSNADEWVTDGSPTHSSTPVRIDAALQFVPKNTNPKEFKQIQQQIKDYRRADKISAGPQSQILEGATWDEARRLQDAGESHAGDHVVLLGAASKGIIQRGFQHNATMYKAPYAKNPFDAVTDDEINEYKKTVERKAKGDYDTDFSESEALSSMHITSSGGVDRRDYSGGLQGAPHKVTHVMSTSETEEESRDEPRILRIETRHAPKPSQPEVVLSDVENTKSAPALPPKPVPVVLANVAPIEKRLVHERESALVQIATRVGGVSEPLGVTMAQDRPLASITTSGSYSIIGGDFSTAFIWSGGPSAQSLAQSSHKMSALIARDTRGTLLGLASRIDREPPPRGDVYRRNPSGFLPPRSDPRPLHFHAEMFTIITSAASPLTTQSYAGSSCASLTPYSESVPQIKSTTDKSVQTDSCIVRHADTQCNIVADEEDEEYRYRSHTYESGLLNEIEDDPPAETIQTSNNNCQVLDPFFLLEGNRNHLRMGAIGRTSLIDDTMNEIAIYERIERALRRECRQRAIVSAMSALNKANARPGIGNDVVKRKNALNTFLQHAFYVWLVKVAIDPPNESQESHSLRICEIEANDSQANDLSDVKDSSILPDADYESISSSRLEITEISAITTFTSESDDHVNDEFNIASAALNQSFEEDYNIDVQFSPCQDLCKKDVRCYLEPMSIYAEDDGDAILSTITEESEEASYARRVSKMMDNSTNPAICAESCDSGTTSCQLGSYDEPSHMKSVVAGLDDSMYNLGDDGASSDVECSLLIYDDALDVMCQDLRGKLKTSLPYGAVNAKTSASSVLVATDENDGAKCETLVNDRDNEKLKTRSIPIESHTTDPDENKYEKHKWEISDKIYTNDKSYDVDNKISLDPILVEDGHLMMSDSLNSAGCVESKAIIPNETDITSNDKCVISPDDEIEQLGFCEISVNNGVGTMEACQERQDNLDDTDTLLSEILENSDISDDIENQGTMNLPNTNFDNRAICTDNVNDKVDYPNLETDDSSFPSRVEENDKIIPIPPCNVVHCDEKVSDKEQLYSCISENVASVTNDRDDANMNIIDNGDSPKPNLIPNQENNLGVNQISSFKPDAEGNFVPATNYDKDNRSMDTADNQELLETDIAFHNNCFVKDKDTNIVDFNMTNQEGNTLQQVVDVSFLGIDTDQDHQGQEDIADNLSIGDQASRNEDDDMYPDTDLNGNLFSDDMIDRELEGARRISELSAMVQEVREEIQNYRSADNPVERTSNDCYAIRPSLLEFEAQEVATEEDPNKSICEEFLGNLFDIAAHQTTARDVSLDLTSVDFDRCLNGTYRYIDSKNDIVHDILDNVEAKMITEGENSAQPEQCATLPRYKLRRHKRDSYSLPPSKIPRMVSKPYARRSTTVQKEHEMTSFISRPSQSGSSSRLWVSFATPPMSHQIDQTLPNQKRKYQSPIYVKGDMSPSLGFSGSGKSKSACGNLDASLELIPEEPCKRLTFSDCESVDDIDELPKAHLDIEPDFDACGDGWYVRPAQELHTVRNSERLETQVRLIEDHTQRLAYVADEMMEFASSSPFAAGEGASHSDDDSFRTAASLSICQNSEPECDTP